ncbi:MAG: hypothetical protein KJ950_13160 [Proteobacteria bacterium]|nr:hypothetical protein [Pseudomonadota bacterium]MBU1688427.1 hypothetical protein [Pseudomonadota bacterium]
MGGKGSGGADRTGLAGPSPGVIGMGRGPSARGESLSGEDLEPLPGEEAGGEAGSRGDEQYSGASGPAKVSGRNIRKVRAPLQSGGTLGKSPPRAPHSQNMGGGNGDHSGDSAGTRASSRPGKDGTWEDRRPEVGDDDYISVSVASVEVGHSLWTFSPEEQRTLEGMVAEAEKHDVNVEVVELLLLVLKGEDEKSIFESIVNFLKEEFRNILAGREFNLAYTLLKQMKSLREEVEQDRQWAIAPLDGYFNDISEPEVLDVLMPLWPDLANIPSEDLKVFAGVLQLLPPKTGESLAPMFSSVEQGQARQLLVELIASFVSRDLEILEKLLARPEEDLILRLVHVLRALTDHHIAEELLGKVLHHPKERVRQETLEILIRRESRQYDKLFSMIHDSVSGIRDMALSYLGQERSIAIEDLFLSYIESDRFLRQDHSHIQACYECLGLCCSEKSLPVLERILFNQPWNFVGGYGMSVHRQGAALALKLLKTPASLNLVNKASHSGVPHIRSAGLKATRRS